MSTNINGYVFNGPHQLGVAIFNDVPGVYLVSDADGKYIDIGETDSLKTRLASHERKDCWRNNANKLINIWFHAEQNEDIRLAKEKQIRGSHPFRCGLI